MTVAVLFTKAQPYMAGLDKVWLVTARSMSHYRSQQATQAIRGCRIELLDEPGGNGLIGVA